MDKIKLLPHNQEMIYEIEKAMVSGHRKIFYTEATGLGKSYIFMYLVHKYFKEKKILYICPKNQVWFNMINYKEFELIKDCVTMMCYADFNKIKPEHIGYDVIFIDEAHHLTAPIQGENILKITDIAISDNSNAFVFGFTATPYVDGNMIGDMFFQKSIIGMDLLNAIDKGILQKINYAVAIKEDIVLSPEELAMTQRYNVDTTHKTVLDLVNQYSHVNHWLVYFSWIHELNDNIKYFEKYFPDYKLFIIHSDIDNCKDAIREYETYNGKAMLLTVSMVLEGVHLNSVEGILLYRNVKSDNTFLQIVGRLGIINPNANPIIVDIYSSYDNFIISDIVRQYTPRASKNDEEKQGTSLSRKSTKNSNDCIYIHSDTYKFIELTSLIYNVRGYSIYKLGPQHYKGYEWTSDRDLSLKLGKSTSYVTQHRRSGKSYEEIIDKVLSEPNISKKYKGYEWTSDRDLSLKLGKRAYYVTQHRQRGKSYEEIIDTVILNKYKGYEWTSNRDLSLKLGKRASYVKNERSKGKSYEEIIDKVLSEPNISKKYKGYEWTSDKDLSLKLGKNASYVSQHRRSGKSYEEIIDNTLDNVKPVYEYRGIIWKSQIELSRILGKNNGYVSYRYNKGETYKEIIDHVLDNK